MSVAASTAPAPAMRAPGSPPISIGTLRVIKRSGSVTDWDPGKISAAIARAFLAVEGASAADSTRIHDIVEGLTQSVADASTRRANAARDPHRRHLGTRRAYGRDTMPRGFLGLNACAEYMRVITNEKNFFETRVIEYQTGSSLQW